MLELGEGKELKPANKTKIRESRQKKIVEEKRRAKLKGLRHTEKLKTDDVYRHRYYYRRKFHIMEKKRPSDPENGIIEEVLHRYPIEVLEKALGLNKLLTGSPADYDHNPLQIAHLLQRRYDSLHRGRLELRNEGGEDQPDGPVAPICL